MFAARPFTLNIATSVDKADVPETARSWKDVLTDAHKEYPDLELVKQFKAFDVVVTGDMFGGPQVGSAQMGDAVVQALAHCPRQHDGGPRCTLRQAACGPRS